MAEILKGRAWVFGDDVDTDLIYHNKYLFETDPNNMPQFSFEYYPGKENFAKEVKPGDFVVAGKNFGCGSSREHAVYCLKYAGVPCLLTENCARIYYRNCISNAYPVLFINGLSKAIEDGDIKADAIDYAHETDKSQVGIEIHSGRNRIVRRIFESLGYRVIKLDRVQFAGLTKKNVRRGDWRFLTEKEVEMLRMGAYE